MDNPQCFKKQSLLQKTKKKQKPGLEDQTNEGIC